MLNIVLGDLNHHTKLELYIVVNTVYLIPIVKQFFINL